MASKREVLVASAEKSLQKGKVDAALKDYLKVLEETPGDINILNKVGDLNVRLGRNEDSIPYFLRIAEHYGHDGFYVRAIAMYKKINKLDPARLDIYEKLAELYVKQQLWMEAKSNYQVLADYLLKQDNLTGAIGIYQKMVAIEQGNLQLHVKLADLFTQAKRIPEALREYGVVAAALSERGANEEAIRVYEKALKLAPDNVEILRTLVPLLLSINAIDQARAVLRKGLEASPRSVPLFLLAADAAFTANDMAEARSYSSKALAVEPENEEVLNAVLKINLKGRRPDLAFAAAAPLADAATRRGEVKKALAILIPIARAAPDADDVVKKIVEIAAGVGDEATALPYRSALAELYRKKGRVAEAADLLRLCSRLQPDNAEFRARLAQLEPDVGPVAATPLRVPPTSIERQMEVTISGFEAALPAPLPAAPAPAPPVPEPVAPPAPAGTSGADEFEFDLVDDELEEAGEPVSPQVEVAPPTPPRGLAAHGRLGRDDSRGSAEPVWGNLTAAEALEAYEARQAGMEDAASAPGTIGPDDIEELRPEAELPVAEAPPSFPQALELDLPTPEGFGPSRDRADSGFPVPPGLGPSLPPGLEWPSSMLPEAELPTAEEEEPVSYPAPARPASEDAALEDALVEADVFRRYGLLEKAVDQLRPWLDRAPGNLKIREKLFEILLEQGSREEALEQAGILADAYGASGREDRIRGLEALIGEPLRVAEAPESLVESAEPEQVAGAEEPETPLPAALDQPVEAPALSLPDFVVPEGFEAPPTEVISPYEETVAGPEPPLEPAVTTVEPEALPPVEELPPAEELPPPEPPAPAPAPLEAAVAPAAVEEVAPPAPPRPAEARPKLSAEDVLGLGKRGAAPAKKVKAVRPEDVELDLLGRAGKPKAKAKAKAEPVLPDDLLRSIRTPAHGTPVVPLPAAPAASSASDLEKTAPDFMPPVPGAPVPDLAPFPPVAEEVPAPPAELFEVPSGPPEQPSREELAELDFCLDQGMVVDAAERLQSLEGRFPGDPELASRRLRLEGGRGGSEASRAALHDILSDDLDSVLDASLGRALTEDMVRESPEPPRPVAAVDAGAPFLDESGLFSDEQEFFNFADELHSELKRETVPAPGDEGREVSLEEIFRDFKRGVEQQLSPEDYETHYNLGIAYKEMGLTDEAIGEFQLAAKDPLHAVECCSMLGLCFLEKGLPQLAVKWYRKGLETAGVKDDDRLGLLYALAGVFEQIGDRDGAYRTYLDIFGTNAGYRDVPERLRELKPFVSS